MIWLVGNLTPTLPKKTKTNPHKKYKIKAMEDRKGKLIEAFNKTGNKAIFRITDNLCPENHIGDVINQYYEIEDEENQFLHLYRWGIERVHIDYEIYVSRETSRTI